MNIKKQSRNNKDYNYIPTPSIIQEANDSMQSLENPQHPYSDSNNRVEQMTR